MGGGEEGTRVEVDGWIDVCRVGWTDGGPKGRFITIIRDIESLSDLGMEVGKESKENKTSPRCGAASASLAREPPFVHHRTISLSLSRCPTNPLSSAK